MCLEVSSRVPESSVRLRYAPAMVWPSADVFVFWHPFFFQQFLRSHPAPFASTNVVLFTHSELPPRAARRIIGDLRHADVVYAMAAGWRDWLIRGGLDERRIEVVYAGCDPELFAGGPAGAEVVGFSAMYGDRKRPDRVFELVEAMPDTQFLLLGRGWTSSPRLETMLRRDNFRYLEPAYTAYPHHYREMGAFVSLSGLEGGPVGLLEAMMCDVVPVATRTGFAPDLIRHGTNGFLIDIDAPISHVAGLVRQALTASFAVGRSVEHLTWERFARTVIAAAQRSR